MLVEVTHRRGHRHPRADGLDDPSRLWNSGHLGPGDQSNRPGEEGKRRGGGGWGERGGGAVSPSTPTSRSAWASASVSAQHATGRSGTVPFSTFTNAGPSAWSSRGPSSKASTRSAN